MKRRELIASVACVLPFSLSGCGMSDSEEPTSTEEQITNNKYDNSSIDDTPARATPSITQSKASETERPTTIFTPIKTYPLREWHSDSASDDYPTWSFRVVSIDLRTEYTLEDVEETYEMPEGDQLAIAHLEVTNSVDDGYLGWTGAYRLAVVYDSRFYPSWASRPTTLEQEIELPDQIDDVDSLLGVEHQRQYLSEGFLVSAGETADLWLVTVIPREADQSDVAVGYDDDFGDQRVYPVRWLPTKSGSTPETTTE